MISRYDPLGEFLTRLWLSDQEWMISRLVGWPGVTAALIEGTCLIHCPPSISRFVEFISSIQQKDFTWFLLCFGMLLSSIPFGHIA